MKNIYEVMRQKEAEIERIKKELQALRIVAPLLEEDLIAENEMRAATPPPVRTYTSVQSKPAPVATAETKPVWP